MSATTLVDLRRDYLWTVAQIERLQRQPSRDPHDLAALRARAERRKREIEEMTQ